jgi:transposase
VAERRTFSDEFKSMIAELALSGKPVREICSEYSLSETAVRKWIKNKAPINIEGETLSLDQIKKIQKENAKLKEEVEILKKAMAIFATK